MPDLFWALVSAWHVERTPVGHRPGEQQNLAVALETPFVESGDRAAAHWGAPAGVRAESVPDFYVEPQALARAIRVLGPAVPTTAVSTVAPAPAEAHAREASAHPANDGLLWAHPVVAALDLAQDRSRGQEILADWTPPPGVHPCLVKRSSSGTDRRAT